MIHSQSETLLFLLPSSSMLHVMFYDDGRFDGEAHSFQSHWSFDRSQSYTVRPHARNALPALPPLPPHVPVSATVCFLPRPALWPQKAGERVRKEADASPVSFSF